MRAMLLAMLGIGFWLWVGPVLLIASANAEMEHQGGAGADEETKVTDAEKCIALDKYEMDQKNKQDQTKKDTPEQLQKADTGAQPTFDPAKLTADERKALRDKCATKLTAIKMPEKQIREIALKAAREGKPIKDAVYDFLNTYGGKNSSSDDLTRLTQVFEKEYARYGALKNVADGIAKGGNPDEAFANFLKSNNLQKNDPLYNNYLAAFGTTYQSAGGTQTITGLQAAQAAVSGATATQGAASASSASSGEGVVAGGTPLQTLPAGPLDLPSGQPAGLPSSQPAGSGGLVGSAGVTGNQSPFWGAVQQGLGQGLQQGLSGLGGGQGFGQNPYGSAYGNNQQACPTGTTLQPYNGQLACVGKAKSEPEDGECIRLNGKTYCPEFDCDNTRDEVIKVNSTTYCTARTVTTNTNATTETAASKSVSDGYADGSVNDNGSCGAPIAEAYTNDQAYLSDYARGLKDCRANDGQKAKTPAAEKTPESIDDAAVRKTCGTALEATAASINVPKCLLEMAFRKPADLGGPNTCIEGEGTAEFAVFGRDETRLNRMLTAKTQFDAGKVDALKGVPSEADKSLLPAAYEQGYACGQAL